MTAGIASLMPRKIGKDPAVHSHHGRGSEWILVLVPLIVMQLA
jgi:hypothetical protein